MSQRLKKIDPALKTLAAFILFGVALGYSLKTGALAKMPGFEQLVPVAAGLRDEANVAFAWPPREGEAYPSLELLDFRGQRVRLADYRGKVLIVEAVAMDCKACQAFAGGHDKGAFGSGQPQKNLRSFQSYFEHFLPGVSFRDEDLVYVQILFYDMKSRKSPSIEDARQWAEHFGLDQSPNALVLIGGPKFPSKETREMIPGFHLVDRNFVLRCDAGKPPRADLLQTLLPMIPVLLDETPGPREPADEPVREDVAREDAAPASA